MTTVADSRVSAICLSLATHSFSLMLSSISLSEMMMSTSLLCTEQWAAWSHHLQLSQHLLKCFDVQQHFEKSVILCFWQSVQLSEINMSWLWIRIVLMYNDWWVLICCSVIQICINKTLSLSRAKWPLSEKSEHTKQAAVDQPQEQNWHQCSQEQKQQCKCCTR